MDPYFSSTRLSLLDRGFIYAIAHIRGGEDLGREWYENGKLLKKKNTFTDFIDCSKFVIAEKYTSSEHLYAEGGSAGGLLMGAIVNIASGIIQWCYCSSSICRCYYNNVRRHHSFDNWRI
jgi:oligopeptidase B